MNYIKIAMGDFFIPRHKKRAGLSALDIEEKHPLV